MPVRSGEGGCDGRANGSGDTGGAGGGLMSMDREFASDIRGDSSGLQLQSAFSAPVQEDGSYAQMQDEAGEARFY